MNRILSLAAACGASVLLAAACTHDFDSFQFKDPAAAGAAGQATSPASGGKVSTGGTPGSGGAPASGGTAARPFRPF